MQYVKHFPPLVRICPITVYNVAMFGGGHMPAICVCVCGWLSTCLSGTRCSEILHIESYVVFHQIQAHKQASLGKTVWWQVTWSFHLHLTAEVEVQGLPDSSAWLRYYDSLCLTVLSLF